LFLHKTIRELLDYFCDVRNERIWKGFAKTPLPPEVTTQLWNLQGETRQAEYICLEGIMRSEDLVRQLETLAKDGRFRAVSALDLENILAAIELCELGFGSGAKVTESLNQLLREEWPTSRWP
jgi:hypothetical protein